MEHYFEQTEKSNVNEIVSSSRLTSEPRGTIIKLSFYEKIQLTRDLKGMSIFKEGQSHFPWSPNGTVGIRPLHFLRGDPFTSVSVNKKGCNFRGLFHHLLTPCSYTSARSGHFLCCQKWAAHHVSGLHLSHLIKRHINQNDKKSFEEHFLLLLHPSFAWNIVVNSSFLPIQHIFEVFRGHLITILSKLQALWSIENVTMSSIMRNAQNTSSEE